MWEGLGVPLRGELVTLEPLRPEHEQGLFEASRDPEIWQWLLTRFAPSREQLAGWLAQSIADSEAGHKAAFATVWRATGAAVGSTRYLTLRPEHRGLEIGWTWLARGRGRRAPTSRPSC